MIRASWSVPSKPIVPEAWIWSYPLPGVVPPSSMSSELDDEKAILPTTAVVGERPGAKVPVKFTLSNVPTPFTYPGSVIRCAGLAPVMCPLLISGVKIALEV